MAAGTAMLVTVCSIDPVLRDTAVGVLVRRLPRAVGLVDGRGVYTHDAGGVDPDCTLCAVRQEIVQAVDALITGPRPPGAIVVGLPAGVDPGLLLLGPCPDGAEFGPVLATLDGATLEWDLSEPALLADWAHGRSDGDRRAIGQAVLEHLRSSDLLVTPTPLSARSRSLVDKVVGPLPDRRIADLRHGLLAELRPWMVERARDEPEGHDGGCRHGHRDGVPPGD